MQTEDDAELKAYMEFERAGVRFTEFYNEEVERGLHPRNFLSITAAFIVAMAEKQTDPCAALKEFGALLDRCHAMNCRFDKGRYGVQ